MNLTNQSILNLIKSYGIIILITLVTIWYIFFSFIPSLFRPMLAQCSLEEVKPGTILMFEGMELQVTQSVYYTMLGRGEIELQKL